MSQTEYERMLELLTSLAFELMKADAREQDLKAQLSAYVHMGKEKTTEDEQPPEQQGYYWSYFYGREELDGPKDA